MIRKGLKKKKKDLRQVHRTFLVKKEKSKNMFKMFVLRYHRFLTIVMAWVPV